MIHRIRRPMTSDSVSECVYILNVSIGDDATDATCFVSIGFCEWQKDRVSMRFTPLSFL